VKIRYARTVALFRVGDRVARIERPNDPGTITAIVADDPAGAVYCVDWDRDAAGDISEAVLVRASPQRAG
jgi:hypothetical protein